MCRVSEGTVKTWVRRGLVDAVRLPSGRLRFKADEMTKIVGRSTQPKDGVQM